LPLPVVSCNTYFMKQKSKLVTYVASSVNYIIVWQETKIKFIALRPSQVKHMRQGIITTLLNCFTAHLEFIWDYPGELVPER